MSPIQHALSNSFSLSIYLSISDVPLFYRKSYLKDAYIYVPTESNSCNHGDIVSVGILYDDDMEPERFKWKIIKNSGVNGYRIQSVYCSSMVLGPKNLACDEDQPITLTDWSSNKDRRQKWVDNSGVDSVREFNVHGTCNLEITLSGNGLKLKKNSQVSVAGDGVSVSVYPNAAPWGNEHFTLLLLTFFCRTVFLPNRIWRTSNGFCLMKI